MAYNPYMYNGYQTEYYGQPVPDQLARLRQQQAQPPMPPMMFQNIQPNTPMQGQPGIVDDRIWVQGEGAAASYLVTANGFVRLWDSTSPIFYEKRADAQGKPLPMDVYEYKRRGDESATTLTPDYESRFDAIEKRLEAIEKIQSPLEK